MWNPNPDLDAATALGQALRAAGYTTEAIEELLGEDGPSADLAESAVFERRLPDTGLAPVLRLLLLQRPVREADLGASLGGDAVDALAALGYVESRDGTLFPRARLAPAEGLLLSFDGFSRGEQDPAGWVAAFTPTAFWLASLTPRRRVERALDVGTGNGAHALLAARHAERVVATDVNARALAFTEINAALNGVTNVETRLGSLYEPVAGERFDLITCNAPYVISPGQRWQYRDGGLPGDEFSERVVRGAAEHLAPGGHASVLVSWLAASSDDPDEHVERWVDGNGCDVWLVSLSGADPLDHAAGWNDQLEDDPDAYGAMLDEWTAYFDALGAHWVSEGAVLMRRRDAAVHALRADSVDEDDLEYAGEQIERIFAGLALDGDRDVLDASPRLADDVRFEQDLDRDGDLEETRLLLTEGTWPQVELEDDELELVLALDGSRTVAAAIEAVIRRLGHDADDAQDFRADALELTRELLELGVLRL
jgi:methylase of polypeptide subunit release factors